MRPVANRNLLTDDCLPLLAGNVNMVGHFPFQITMNFSKADELDKRNNKFLSMVTMTYKHSKNEISLKLVNVRETSLQILNIRLKFK